MSSTVPEAPVVSWRGALALWTVGIWGSRLRNALADDELVGSDRFSAIGVAAVFVALGVIVGVGVLRRQWQWQWPPLLVLVIVGVVRWTIRGPIILLSDEWSVGFKVVHTVLWLVTVLLSVRALREHPRVRNALAKDLRTGLVG